MSESASGGVVDALLAWYEGAARDLPWRRTRDPYAIWVSETMLQQTRVETVIPYYQRFLERFPDVQALAAASEDEVLGLWQGLGYYRRARQLHGAAQEVIQRYGGELPRTAEGLAELRGIGRYTAGAIASIAFGRPEAVVDGNVARVLARLWAIDEDVGSTAGRKLLWARAEGMVPEQAPGRFNEALMELGATVCLPSRPRCDRCPLSETCLAHRQGRTEELPRKKSGRSPARVELAAAVVIHGRTGRYLLGQRQRGGLFGGLWEPPMTEARDGVRAALAKRGVAPSIGLSEAGRIEHALTHRRLGVAVSVGTARRAHRPTARPPAPYERLAWCAPGEVALSTLARRLIEKARPHLRSEASD